jgi:hypothetical protein
MLQVEGLRVRILMVLLDIQWTQYCQSHYCLQQKLASDIFPGVKVGFCEPII